MIFLLFDEIIPPKFNRDKHSQHSP